MSSGRGKVSTPVTIIKLVGSSIFSQAASTLERGMIALGMSLSPVRYPDVP